jgi:hypothetical protein
VTATVDLELEDKDAQAEDLSWLIETGEIIFSKLN